MEHKCKKTYLKTVEKCELNAENIKNEIQSLIKALKDCGGWVKRGNGEGWFNHEILEDALAIITSQEQRIKELTEENDMAEYKIPKFEYKPIPEEMLLKMDYKSPIEAIRHEMEMRFENDVMKAVQQHDIYVDKSELLKALQHDRNQYTKGFQDGCGDKMDKLVEQVKADIVKKTKKRLHQEAFAIFDDEGGVDCYAVDLNDIDRVLKEIIDK